MSLSVTVKMILPFVTMVTLAGCQHSIAVQKIPTPLTQIDAPKATLAQIFKASLYRSATDNIAQKDRVDLQVAVDDDLMIVASHSGVVQGFKNGVPLWQVFVGEPIVSGVGYDQSTQVIIVTTRLGKVMALDAKTGALYWQRQLDFVVLTPALIANNRVLLSANDGTIYGLVLQTGAIAWQYKTPHPTVSSRGGAKPLQIGDNAALFGTAEGKIYALSIDLGNVLWSRRIGVAAGNEIGHHSDVDGTPLMVDNKLYVTSISGQLLGLDMTTGQNLFTISHLPTLHSVAQVDTVLIGADVDGAVYGFDKMTGKILWQNDSLKYRKPSSPATIGEFVAFGDYDGVVHLFTKEGILVGRAKTQGQITSLKTHQNHLYTQTQSGQVAVWRVD